MREINKLEGYPENTLITKDLASVDYHDSYGIVKETNDSIDEITRSGLPPIIRTQD